MSNDEAAIAAMARAMRTVLEGDGEIWWASEYGMPIPEASVQSLATAALAALREMEGRDGG